MVKMDTLYTHTHTHSFFFLKSEEFQVIKNSRMGL